MIEYYCPSALLPDGWRDNVIIAVNNDGDICRIEPNSIPTHAVHLSGVVVAGMPNLHSHAHQRAMAGLTERSGPGPDSFWTWRELMYRFLARITPDDLEVIASQLYLEMLKAGYTAVGEFQYLHHDPAGKPYSDRAEMSLRTLAAAEYVGIGLTSLPVLYARGDFGGIAPTARQQRFINDAEGFLKLFEQLQAVSKRDNYALGIAPHSLRAVPPELLVEVMAAIDSLEPDCPIHIHIAEQRKEVEDCLAWSGQRPVQWLLAHQALDSRWCLIHATHLDDSELHGLASSEAIVGLCPTTEANLGDGIFPAVDFIDSGGRFGIGSDSHISISPVEELRWLEYGQRLQRNGRNLLAGGPERSTGHALYQQALAGGARALGRDIGRLAPGYRADMLVLDTDSPLLFARSDEAVLDSWLFSGNQPLVKDVCVGGRWVVKDGVHQREIEIKERYHAVLRDLLSAL